MLLEAAQSQAAIALTDKKANSDQLRTHDVSDGLELTVLIGSSRSESGATSPRELSDSQTHACWGGRREVKARVSQSWRGGKC